MTFEEQFTQGVELFNSKEFFECHDVWEEMWQEERGESRLFLQGMIQAAVGCYHLSNGNTTGAISQYTKSLDKLKQYPSNYFDLDLGSFIREIERCQLGALTMKENGATYEVNSSYFPHLSFSSIKNQSK